MKNPTRSSANQKKNTKLDSSAHIVSMTTGTATLEPMLTMDDLCELTKMAKSTLYSLRSEGRGPVGFRIGKSLRFLVTDVVAWLESLREGQNEVEA
jgi:predicted DNA-binding transcriptional regulator AlpA